MRFLFCFIISLAIIAFFVSSVIFNKTVDNGSQVVKIEQTVSKSSTLKVVQSKQTDATIDIDQEVNLKIPTNKEEEADTVGDN